MRPIITEHLHQAELLEFQDQHLLAMSYVLAVAVAERPERAVSLMVAAEPEQSSMSNSANRQRLEIRQSRLEWVEQDHRLPV
jgi:hypothetical protein